MTLLHENDSLKVELEFLVAVSGLLESHLSVLELLNELLLLILKVVDEVAEMTQTILVLLLATFHSDTDVSLMGNLLELLRHDLGEHVSIALEVIYLLLLLLLDQLFNGLEVDLAVRIKEADVTLHLILLLLWHLDLALRLSALDEVLDAARLQVLGIADRLDASLLICEALIALHHLIVLSVLVVADVHEVLLILKHLLLLDQVLTELDDVSLSLLHVMKGNREPDDHELLLLDASLVEDPTLVRLHELLLELALDLDDLDPDTLQVDEPLLALLLLRVSHTLLEFLQPLLLVFTQLIERLVHPLFSDELLIKLVLLLLEDKLVTTEHTLETTLTHVITLKKCLFFETLALNFFKLTTLSGREDSLTVDFKRFIDLKDVLGFFFWVPWELLKINRLLQALQQVTNLLVLLADGEKLIVLELLKMFELSVEIALKLEDHLLEELDLSTLPSILVKLVWLIDQLKG